MVLPPRFHNSTKPSNLDKNNVVMVNRLMVVMVMMVMVMMVVIVMMVVMMGVMVVVVMVMVVMLKHHQVSDSQLEGRRCLWVRDGPTEGTGIYRDSEKLPQDESRPTKESISYGVFCEGQI